MADYSGYTIKRPHSLTPLTSVYEAVAADGRPGRFALKIFHPPASTNARRWYAIEGWLLAAERQQQSAKKDGTVLEVLALGRCEEGAFAVLPWQERLLEPLIKTLHPKGDTLRALGECLLNTIEKWEKQTGGPHGNVKPSNVFFDRTGPLVGMTAQLSDPAFMPGASIEALRTADLAGVGTMLAQIVRRRPPGAWPIEDAPEWKALGNGGKGWLDFCNYLLNPSPEEGKLTITEARRLLRKVPKDSNPVKTAVLTVTAVVVLVAGSILGFARFGDPIYMPFQIRKLAETVRNPRAFRESVTPDWALLCRAWDTWLIDLQNNAGRLNRNAELWAPSDPLKAAITTFVATANRLRPETLVPEAAAEKRLGVLGDSPPDVVRKELLKGTVADAVSDAWRQLNSLRVQLERWQRWEEMRALLTIIEARGFTRAAAALSPRLPPARASFDYKLDIVVLTLKLFNDLSLDDTGTLLLASRWSEITKHQKDMLESNDRIQQAMPDIILGKLTDRSTVGNFADSLGEPLDEMRLRRKHFLDPAVVRERFLKESDLLKETAVVSEADFPRWEQELVLFSLVPAAEDPRLRPDLDASGRQLTQDAVDLEQDAPVGEPGNPATLSQPDFQREYTGLTAGLKSLRDRPIVRRDLPAIVEETEKMAGVFRQMEERLAYTLTLLKPEIWLAKVAQAFGKFNETRQRWAAWQQAALTGVTADSLRGLANRPRFRELRADERKVKEWINGVEGDTGFGALSVPELTAASADTGAELLRLEAVRREQAVAAVATAAKWSNAVPVTPWAAASATEREPLEAHRTWLGQLVDFAKDLDHLSDLLLAGIGWTEGVGEGVSEVAGRLDARLGVGDLTGRPAEWYAEAKQLQQLNAASDRGVLTAAAQSGGLSRKLMAWRRLGTLSGWPAGPEDFDLDTGVVTVMREVIGRDVKEESRKGSLLDELVKETRRRFNLAAHRAAVDEAQLTAMFERMEPAGITDTDLDAPVAYNLALWGLKRSDWNEKNLDRLGKRRDTFVTAVRRIIPGIPAPAQPAVSGLLDELNGIELKDDPNRAATNSPENAGWEEELKNQGLTLTATWTNGTKKVSLDYNIVQPTDGMSPFYLAQRQVAVGEFVDLINANIRSKETEEVLAKLPKWARGESANKPYNTPMAWRPRFGSSGNFTGLELNPAWISNTTAQVKGLLDDLELRAQTPALEQAVAEKPTLRSPLQQIVPSAAKIFAEKLLGARLPTIQEWQAVMKIAGPTTNGNFRGSSFQNLFNYLRDYNVAGQTIAWRPNEGAFPLMVTPADGGKRTRLKDDGQAGADSGGTRLWLAPVDEGTPTVPGGFINLTGNVWVYLHETVKANETVRDQFYVAGGSALSPPGIDLLQPQKVEVSQLIGATTVTEGFSDVGIRPAFDAPPGFRERYKLIVLVREQKYLTL